MAEAPQEPRAAAAAPRAETGGATALPSPDAAACTAGPDDGTWRIATPARACTTTAGGITTLTVEVACTCGEPIACEVATAHDHLDALVTLDPRAPAICDDCYSGTAACTLPSSAHATRPLSLNGLHMPLTPCVQ